MAHNFSANLFLTDEQIQENKKEMLKKKELNLTVKRKGTKKKTQGIISPLAVSRCVTVVKKRRIAFSFHSNVCNFHCSVAHNDALATRKNTHK